MSEPCATRLVDLIAEAKREGQPGRLTDVVPYARFMGLSMRHVAGELLGHLTYSHTLVGNPALPALHGGALGALLESTAIFQLLWEAETVVLPKTIDITIEYLRSGRPLDTWARGILTRQGRRVANVRVEAWQEDRQRPIAIAHAHFLILPGEDEPDADAAR
ncbi:MAG TPA: PaaI family thioesterase [Kofleriaceae bacterium]|nr:PaaI family thioesterase [Kofleriaceae bacterium]